VGRQLKIIWGASINQNIAFNLSRRRRKLKISYNFPPGINPNPGRTFMEYTIITDGADCYPWREVYAWWPRRTITGQTVWLEKVFKRRVWVVWGTGFHMEPEVEFATLFDLISHDYDPN